MNRTNYASDRLKVNENVKKECQVYDYEDRHCTGFGLLFGRIFVIALMGFEISVAAFGWYMFLVYGNLLVTTLILTVVTALSIHIITKSLRKRLVFLFKLRRMCRKHGFVYKPERGFFKSFFWSSDKLDFTLKTRTHIYYVHYLTMRKYRCVLTFLDEHTFESQTRPLKNRFTVIFNFKPKTKRYTVTFPERSSQGAMKKVNAILVNPTCCEFNTKNKNGSLEPTGNGAECYGYTLFTGSGFIRSVLRNEENL